MTELETRTILVAGATGQQGGTVARTLRKRGHEVRGLTRSPNKAGPLRDLEVDPVLGDMTDRAGMERALHGADGFFLVTTWFETGTEDETRQGITSLDAAKAMGVDQIVFNSVGSADRAPDLRHFVSKHRIEQHLRGLALPATIVRPVAFMDNFTSPWMAQARQTGTIALPLKPTTRVHHVAVADLGPFVADRFERRDGIGETIELAGDVATFPEIATMLGLKVGHPIRFVEMSDEQGRAFMGDEGVLMNRWFDNVGYNVDVPALEERWGMRMTRFREFFHEAAMPPLASNLP